MNLLLRIGLSGLALIVGAALIGPILAPFSPEHMDITRELLPPGEGSVLGTGVNGIDVFSWVLHGAGISLTVGLSVVFVSLSVGLVMGTTAGYFGGRFDFVLMRVIDVLLAFPGILLAIYIAAVLPPSLTNVVLALSATGWVGYAR